MKWPARQACSEKPIGMKYKLINSGLIILAGIPLLLILIHYIESAFPYSIPGSLIGDWKSTQKVTIRFNTGGNYSFKTSAVPVPLQITILQDGRVAGTIGDAVFKDCSLHKNQGWVNKLINFSTDFMIIGAISGKIFPDDTLCVKGIRFPFYQVAGNTVHATMFQSKGMDIFPMADILLVKQTAVP